MRTVNFVPALVAGLLVVCLAHLPLMSEGAPRPNVLLILADDLGFSDLGCYGGEIATPNLDSLAENGLRFTRFYNTGRCWPTRGSILTGFYAQQIRRDELPDIPSGGGNRGIRPDWAVLLPQLLKASGYRSYHTGKWHIDGMPIQSGFDQSYYLLDQGRFFNPTKHWKDDVALPPVEKNTGFYATVALADHAIEVLREHDVKHADAPFFHYLAFAAPHFPLHALPEDIAVYQDTYTPGWDAIRAQRWNRLRQMNLLDPGAVPGLSRVERDLGPPYHFPDAFEILGPGEVNRPMPWSQLSEDQKSFQSTKMAIHAAMIHRMDLEIGRVFDQIKKMGQWENTLVIFLSDNGASAEIMVRDDGHDPQLPPGAADTYLCLGPGWSTVGNTPFRRHKTWTHEGGTATPFVVSWPAGIPARGEIRRQAGHVIDFVPTILELAGANPHPDAPPAPGRSLTPAFASPDAPGHQSLWWFHDGHKAILQGDWKAVAPKGQPWELYHLVRDRIESLDLAVQKPDILRELTSAWEGRLVAFTEQASRDLPPEALAAAKAESNRRSSMVTAQDIAQPPSHQVLPGGESFLLNGRRAFLMTPEKTDPRGTKKPWIFYGPTLPKYPDEAESAMHQRFLEAGVAVAGIDVGEAYGSPLAFPHFEALYREMAARGYADKPALLGRSRGGLWVSSWAIGHPGRVAGIGGIYPVFDFTTYPGLDRAAPAYDATVEELRARANEWNPIRRAKRLAQAKIPVYIIHGEDDTVVPLASNSGTLESIYQDNEVGHLLELTRVPGQGHNFWTGFFNDDGLVNFLIQQARLGVRP